MKLDPDKPMAIDLLSEKQRRVYLRHYRRDCPLHMDPAEKHRRSWKRALRKDQR